MAARYLEAFPHDPIEEVFDEVFFVRGSIKMGMWGTMNRNMTIVRHDGELTLINAVRLEASEEERLRKLGTVKHVMKIGFFHGADDPYYVETFGAKLWALPGHQHKGGLATDQELAEHRSLPFPGASLFEFRNSKKAEAIVHLERQGGVLVSCDACQNWIDDRFAGLTTKVWSRVMGFRKPANIGPGFRMFVENKPKEGPSLKPDFERLLDRDFKHLVPAHGAVLKNEARHQLRDTVRRIYH